MKSKHLPLAGLLIIGILIGASGSTAAATIENSILGGNTAKIGLIDHINSSQRRIVIARADQDRIDGIIWAKSINGGAIIDKSNISDCSLIAIEKIIGAEIQINQIDAEITTIAA